MPPFSFKHRYFISKNIGNKIKQNMNITEDEKRLFKFACVYYVTFGSVMGYYHF